MTRTLWSSLLSAVPGLLLTACVVSPPPGTGTTAGIVPADARALRFGASAPEVFNNPELNGKLMGLFGPDWNPGGRLAVGAPAYFPPSSPLRMIRVGDADYVAIAGCVPHACSTHRGLLLIRQDGQQLSARLDEGGFSHYYDFGPGVRNAALPRPWIDAAWRTIQGVERG